MRWPDKSYRRYDWKPWFAWYPISIGATRVWLEWVNRKLYSDPWDDYFKYEDLKR